jgi:hypothetical protein
MLTDLGYRVTVRDPRTLAFVFRRGGAKAHLVALRGGVRLVRATCGRALPDDQQDDQQDDQSAHTVVVLSEAWWPSNELCARCLRQAQEQQLVVVSPYRAADRRSDARHAALTMSRALLKRNTGEAGDGEDRQS